MYLLRARFKKDIIAEFLPPSRVLRGGSPPKRGDKVIILCGGMPSVPSAKNTMEFLSKKGFWVFFPRYRGTWESGGAFLMRSPHLDILDVIDGVYWGNIMSLFEGTSYVIRPKSLFIIASSFGGPAGILASRDERVKKVVALSPVIDWRASSKTESFDELMRFTRQGFGQAYRGSAAAWRKLRSGTFYDPAAQAAFVDGSKLLIVHASDDDAVPAGPAKKFARKTGARLVLLSRGGHFSLSRSGMPAFWRRIARFFAEK